MSLAAKIQLRAEQGSRFKKVFRRLDAEGLPVDWTGFTPRFTVRKAIGGGVLLALRESALVVNGFLDGAITINIPADTMQMFDGPSAVYDLEMAVVEIIEYPFQGIFTFVLVTADNGVGHGVIEANAGNPFADVSVGDLIRISNSESGNDGTYEVAVVTTQDILTFTTPLTGVNNGADTQMVIERLVEDRQDVFKLASGRISIEREATTWR